MMTTPLPSRVWDDGDFDRDMAHENGDEEAATCAERGYDYDPDEAQRRADARRSVFGPDAALVERLIEAASWP